MNDIRKQIFDIAKLIDGRKIFIEVKRECPFCGEYTLLLREIDTRFYCLKCEQDGSLDELEMMLYRDIQESPGGVNL